MNNNNILPAEKNHGIVLIVDDEPDIYWVFEKIIRKIGLRTALAKNGLEALQYVKQLHVKLAFVDAKLPDIEGIKLIPQLKQELPDLPFVLISGFFNKDDYNVQQWLKAGIITDFISKPFSHNLIKEIILRRIK